MFISNGPGDPALVDATILNLRKAIQSGHDKPICGICMGNQLVALAAGAKVYFIIILLFIIFEIQVNYTEKIKSRVDFLKKKGKKKRISF